MRPTDQHQPLSPASGASRPAAPTTRSYVACYALYAVVLAACYLNFVLWNNAVQLTVYAIVGRQMSLEASYAFTMLLVIGALFLVALWSEHKLRTAVPRGQLRSTFNHIGGGLLGAAFVAIVIATAVDRLVIR